MTAPHIIDRPPPIPSKWDIIPIHTSDIANYKRCRRYWDWSSPTRTNLRHKVRIFGISVPLWFGTGIHYALENYYNPALQRDPVESFVTWWTLQWEGGLLPEHELNLSYDINPKLAKGVEGQIDPTTGQMVFTRTPGALFHVEGLRDMLPNPDEEEFLGYKELGIGMMNFYKDYAQRNDDFEVISAEASYSIPLGFEHVDIREDSPNYGTLLEVHARGKRDAIIYRPSIGRFGIYDHKTVGKAITEEYFVKLDKDEQCSNYIWASEQEAILFDKPWKEISEICYNAIRKGFPVPPTPLKDSTPSLARSTETTTAELFEQYIRDNGLLQWYQDNTKAKNYYTWLLENGDKTYVWREYSRRNAYERKATGEHIRMIAKEMLGSPSIYPSPTGEYLCLRCAFRGPCIAKDDGSDWKGMLSDGYEMNRDR